MRRLTLLWSLLIAATLISSASAGSSAAVFIYAIALFKARCVILYMMDVRTAPVALRVLMELWVVGMWITLSVLHTVST